ncbi:hypothetical protein [Qipengyuania sp.]|uniref:hypothetical protein n=1 Tax=Qipengyuania sp. TaxID=2004515 RepID=UPI003736D760
MRTLFLTGAAALALTSVPVLAQDETPKVVWMKQVGDNYELSTDQQTAYQGWPDDRRNDYDAWPRNVQEYYWTLDTNQTQAWWILNNDQRARIIAMTPEQRAAAWTSIAAQMSGATAPADTTGMQQGTMQQGSTAMAGQSRDMGQMQFVRGEVVQTTPADQQPASGEMPICTANQQDNCMNAWEAGKRGKGVNRPLEEWPGRPASEM